MIVSYTWLKTLIDFDLTVDELSALLTDTGLEVEKVHKIESIKGGLEGLLIGKVLTCEKAENSDKLKVTTVDIGGKTPLNIVCGAPNVAANQYVVVAPVGCTIYPLTGEPFTIKKAKIRGNLSEGMICAEDEIGLGSSHDGIMVLNDSSAIGQPFRDSIDLKEDYQIEIGLTPNRGDAASHLGTARDIKAIVRNSLKLPEVMDIPEHPESGISVEVLDTDKCPRYTGIVLDNVTVGESPDWLKERLKSIDLNPINNVVDTTNFVLHELGQPIHAFDADEIDGGIRVRNAKLGEKITTLDEVERDLTGDELLITDHSRPLAIAGVFGGLNSGVSNKTTRVFIESAYFDPAVVRKSAKTHGLNTDASFRYERGCDPNITEYALKRVATILQEVAGAQVASKVSDFYPNPVSNTEITVDMNWLNQFLGTNLATETVIEILAQLDINTLSQKDNSISVSVPPFRSDVLRPVDIAEEVLRIYGFNQVDIPTRLSMTPSIQPDFNPISIRNRVADYLVGKGFYETMSNSQTKQVDRTSGQFVELLNPLSNEQAIMRTDMYDGILNSVAYNLNRKNKDILFFEFGKTYFKTEKGFDEKNNLILVESGSTARVNWATSNQKADYFHLKGIIQTLSNLLGVNEKKLLKMTSLEVLDRNFLKSYNIKQDVVCAVIDWDRVLNLVKNVKFNLQDVPVFPVVTRDLSIVLDQATPFSEIDRISKEVAGNFLKDLEVFDVYEGDRLDVSKKAYAISVKLYDAQQTMTDKKIDKIMEKMMGKFESQVNAIIRK